MGDHQHCAVRRSAVAVMLAGLPTPAALGLLAAAPAGSAAPAGPAIAHRDPAGRYITALVDKKEVAQGKRVRITGAVHADDPTSTACTAGVTLDVERSTKGAIYRVIGQVTTDAGGAFAVKEVVTKKSRFRLSAPATATCAAAQSPPRTVSVID